MKFDIFFSISQTPDTSGHVPSETEMFANFLDQAEKADELGFGVGWVAQAHLSTEVQKQNSNPVVPHYPGEVGLCTDFFQAEDGIRDRSPSRGLGDVYKRQLPGFTDTDRLGSLAGSISQRTGKSVEEVQETWMNSVPIQRLIDPMETAAAVTFLCLPSSGGIRGVSLAVDGGRMRSI